MPESGPTLLILDFPARAPGGEAQRTALRALAESIATEPGLLWKLWTHGDGRAGGAYLFTDRAAAEAYHAKHAARLAAQGIGPIDATYRAIDAELSRIDRGPLPARLAPDRDPQ